MEDPAQAGIAVTDVRRSFGTVHAVRNASFEARAGRVTGLIGPNGSGKTTLLLMLASLLAPDAGSIRVGGADPTRDPAAARSILGWMPDALGAWERLTVRETLIVTGRLYDLERTAAAERADELIALLGLAELATAPARVLSRGQKQRLGLARALVHDPRVLLLDEPASGLDPAARVELRGLLRDLAAEGTTVLVSSHVLAELEEMVDDAVFLLEGATVEADRVADAGARARAWRIRVLGEQPEIWRDRVAAALGRPDAGVDRRDIVASFANEDEAARGLRALVDAGVPVTEFAPAGGRLEHTLLDLHAEGTE